MADSNTMRNLQNLTREIENLELKGNSEAHVRGELLELLYKAAELLECLVADSAELPPLKLKPGKKGSE